MSTILSNAVNLETGAQGKVEASVPRSEGSEAEVSGAASPDGGQYLGDVGTGIDVYTGDECIWLKLSVTGGVASKSGKMRLTATSHGWGQLFVPGRGQYKISLNFGK